MEHKWSLCVRGPLQHIHGVLHEKSRLQYGHEGVVEWIPAMRGKLQIPCGVNPRPGHVLHEVRALQKQGLLKPVSNGIVMTFATEPGPWLQDLTSLTRFVLLCLCLVQYFFATSNSTFSE